MDRLAKIVAIRTGGTTERCHGIRHQGSYSVAAHTWGVLALLYVLWPKDYARLAAAVTFHDVPEAWVGDIPAPTKRYSHQIKATCDELEGAILTRLELPNCKALSLEDRSKISACDRLELYFWAQEEVAAGNTHARCVISELERFFVETPLPLEAKDLVTGIQEGFSVEHRTDRLIKELLNESP